MLDWQNNKEILILTKQLEQSKSAKIGKKDKCLNGRKFRFSKKPFNIQFRGLKE